MALVVTILQNDGAIASRKTKAELAVFNTGPNSVVVTQAQVSAGSGGAAISQPDFLTPNVASGSGQPTIAAGAVAYFPFSFAPVGPAYAGQPINAVSPYRNGVAPVSAPLVLSAVVSSYDATASAVVTGSATVNVPVRAAIGLQPPSPGGALQFNGSPNAVNIFLF